MGTDTEDGKLPVERVKIVMKPAVGWFSVKLLIMTGIQALITSLVGPRSARREVLAVLDGHGSTEVCHNSAVNNISAGFDFRNASENSSDEIWIDYVADLGDGFNGTHSVSWLLGRDFLFLKKANDPVEQPIPVDSFSEAKRDAVKDADHVLPAGNILIFGGDQVYPAASQIDYQDRTIGPYYASRPWSDYNPAGPDDEGRRSIFSIPGNHDWYDGLNSYIKNFCQPNRWMGCWQVQQRRSYFSLRLPNGFWIWGLDLATDDDIDLPQMEYFKQQAELLGEHDQVILCVPKPAWLDLDASHNNANDRKENSWDPWSKIEIISNQVTLKGKSKRRVPLIIAGDYHYYTHHQSDEPEQKDKSHYIICGGGGAFTLGTATVPKKVNISNTSTAEHQVSFPDEKDSIEKRVGVFWLFYHHKFFCTLLSSIMLAVVWLVHTSSLSLLDPSTIFSGPVTKETQITSISGPFLETARFSLHSWLGFKTLIHDFLAIIIYRPGVLAVIVALMLGFGVFASSARAPNSQAWISWSVGVLHFIVQLTIAFIITAFLWTLMAQSDLPLIVRLLVYLFIGLSVGWLLNGLFLSVYIWLSNSLFKMHEQEIYSSQSIEDWKSFLRIKIDREGLTIFPIGLRKACNAWEVAPHPGPYKTTVRTDTFYGVGFNKTWAADVPKGTTHLFQPKAPLAPQLLEEPIFIPSTGGVHI